MVADNVVAELFRSYSDVLFPLLFFLEHRALIHIGVRCRTVFLDKCTRLLPDIVAQPSALSKDKRSDIVLPKQKSDLGPPK